MVSCSTIRGCLNELPLETLMEVQRCAGREYLPISFRKEWAATHLFATSIATNPDRSALTRDMGRVLFAATYFVGNVAAGTQPNYYEYMDGRMLDWYLGPDTEATDSLVHRSVVGVHALMEALHGFETASLIGGVGHNFEHLDRTQILVRLPLIEELLEKTQQLGATDVEEPMSFSDPLESFAASTSRLSALITLSGVPLTQSHDEVLFVRVLQASELCFLGIRIAVTLAVKAIISESPRVAVQKLQLAIRFASFLRDLLRVLRTMPVAHFATFRELTGKASALQSVGFHLMDTLLHGLNTEKLEHFRRIEHFKPVLSFCEKGFVSLKQAMLGTDERRSTWQEVWAACRQLDKDLLTWRGLHLGFAKRYIPHGAPGTGGTAGANYLLKHLFRGIFDDHQPDWDAVHEMFPELAWVDHPPEKRSVLIVP
jgi:tryptophan 2,3-dioxygenase